MKFINENTKKNLRITYTFLVWVLLHINPVTEFIIIWKWDIFPHLSKTDNLQDTMYMYIWNKSATNGTYYARKNIIYHGVSYIMTLLKAQQPVLFSNIIENQNLWDMRIFNIHTNIQQNRRIFT
jgi:hypothetical protein